MIAYAMLRKGERHLKTSKLSKDLKKDIQTDSFSGKVNQALEEIVVIFSSVGESNALPIHQSIADYLVAEGIFTLLQEATKNFDDKEVTNSCDKMAEKLISF